MKKQISTVRVIKKALGLLVVAAWPLAGAGADGPTWTTIDVPGAGRTAAFGLNGTRTVVGDYAALAGGPVRGFAWTAGVFTLIDVPGAKFTRPLGINDAGDIVGYWQDNKGGSTHGFLLRGGVYTLFDVPGAASTRLGDINDEGNIVGTYRDQDGASHGFLLDSRGLTTIDVPGAVYTEAWRSNRRQIAGRYADAAGVFHVFLLGKGVYTTLPVFPGAVETASEWYSFAGGLDDSGGVCSQYCSAQPCAVAIYGTHSEYSPGCLHGYTYRRGVFTAIEVPGAGLTTAFDLNPSGDVTGTYFTLDGGEHGYLRKGGD